MKFGQNLPRNQVPEWSDEYINYKGLKKLIKSAAEVSKNGRETDLTSFFYALDRNLEDVDGFYNKKYAEAARRLKLLRDRYGSVSDIQEGNRDEIEDLYGALLDLRSELRNLQWYGEVNRRGFIKITKKLDKKVAQSSRSQHRYIPFRVDPRPFASNKQLTKDLQEVNNWLSGLGDINVDDDASSTHSSISLSRGASKVTINLPRELLEDVDKSIRLDNVKLLTNSLSETQEYNNSQSAAGQRFFFNLLQRSISSQSRQCIAYLISKLASLDEDDDINQRNCIHRLVISIGRTSQTMNGDQSPSGKLTLSGESSTIAPAEAPKLQATQFAAKELEQKRPVKAQDPSAKLLAFVLDCLSEDQRVALNSRDAQGRLPLHYAAKYGVLVLCDILIERMRVWGQFDLSSGFDSEYWFDEDKQTPLHFAVSGGHIQTTQALLDACRVDQTVDVSQQPQRLLDGSSKLLSLAVKANFVNIVGLLVAAGADVNSRDIHAQGETPLHVAARYGHVECAKVLQQGSKWCQLDINVTEETFGWTPLMIASVDGQEQMARFLIESGANFQATDVSGWTAKEHAALRGHIKIARILNERATQAETSSSNGQTTSSSVGERQSGNRDQQSAVKPSKPVKTFGHKYLTKECMVLISLGSMDHRKNINPVTLDNIPLNEAHATQLDTALSVVVSASGAHGEPTTIDLPVQETISTEPMAFYAQDLSKVKIKFDIVPTYAGSNDQVVGRAIANLKTIRPDVGSKRMNLQGDIALPILSAKDLECIGEVHFNFLVITPFAHENMSVNQNQTYWKRLETGPMVIGHRGLGKNMASRRSLQLGENTIQSFITAANLGASYVEFDVQLTKDHVPVIYHDFLVSETGIDAPVHSLTLEQFLHLQEEAGRSPRGSQPPTPDFGPQGGRLMRGRANSMGVPNDLRGDSAMTERMKHTADFKRKGFKGNLRGHSIQSPFTTLEEMLKKLPKHLGFNIEMKYPMLWETEEDSMDTYAVELNAFVDAVLRKIYDMGPGRDIIFSSFNPDVCLLLSFKQPNIPILFLTDAGCSPTGDIRATSLQEAIRFASRWNLLGIVSAAEPLVLCPRLVRVVKETGLVCVTYGVLNNEPDNVKAQWREGIDAVIVDSVLAVRKGLTHEDPHAAAPTTTNGAANRTGNESTSGSASDSVDKLADDLEKSQVQERVAAAS